MSATELERLRAVDPIPTDPGAPPIDRLLARIEATDPGTGPGHDAELVQSVTSGQTRRTVRQRVRGRAVPLAITATLAVTAAVLVVVLVHAHQAARAARPLPLPRGLPGQVASTGVALSPGGAAAISAIQCIACDSPETVSWNHVPVSWTYRLWTTSDDGDSWRVTQRPWFLEHAVFSGSRNGWATGIEQNPYPEVALVTHDGGETWRRVAVPHTFTRLSISIAGAEVWATAAACVSHRPCRTVVLRGPTSGNRLTPVPSPPAGGGRPQIAGTGATSAFVSVRPVGGAGATSAFSAVQPLHGRSHRHVPLTFVTDDDGHSWQRVFPVCVGAPPAGDGHGAIWQSCGSIAGIGRSTDGGRTWNLMPAPFGLKTPQLVPVSASVAWALTGAGWVFRTTDGGHSWTRLKPRFPSPRLTEPGGTGTVGTVRRRSVQLAATSVEDAEIVTTRTAVDYDGLAETKLSVSRTSDGGAHWQRVVVGLPAADG